MRLIDADALIPMMKYATTDSEIGVFPIKIGFNDIEKVINEQPTVDTVKHAHWIDQKYGVYKCSNCRNFLDFGGVNAGRGDANYCPNCGAKMYGFEEE